MEFTVLHLRFPALMNAAENKEFKGLGCDKEGGDYRK